MKESQKIGLCILLCKPLYNKKGLQSLKPFPDLVGARRLELPTPCTPCKYASQLRHAPNIFILSA